MILYRAINKKDEESLKKYNEIICSYSHTYLDYVIKYKDIDEKLYNKRLKSKIARNYRIYMLCDRKEVLDGTLGHINGQKLKCNRSPWISTTTDYRFAITEYAVPQAGVYNTSIERKPIIVIEKNNIYKEVEKIKELRNSKEENFGIDLRNKNLENLFEECAIESETKYRTEDTRVTGLSNFATAANEVLIYKRIPKEDIKLILYPFMQDIIYTCNIDMDKSYEFIKEHEQEIKEIYNDLYNQLGNYSKIFKELYPTYEKGNNLTELLIKYYECLPCDTIENKYEYMKHIKRKILEKAISEINKKLNQNIKLYELVDEKVLVKNINRIGKKEKKVINDIIIIEKNGTLYRFSPSTSEYISVEQEKIKKQKLKELTK